MTRVTLCGVSLTFVDSVEMIYPTLFFIFSIFIFPLKNLVQKNKFSTVDALQLHRTDRVLENKKSIFFYFKDSFRYRDFLLSTSGSGSLHVCCSLFKVAVVKLAVGLICHCGSNVIFYSSVPC